MTTGAPSLFTDLCPGLRQIRKELILVFTLDKESLSGGALDARTAGRLVLAFECERLPRLARLRAYYDGEAPISHRRRVHGAPNNRLSHPFARYLVTMASGYLAGCPVRYASETQPEALAATMAAYRAANSDNLDAELAAQASLYGVGTELLYLDERARLRFATLDPTRAFVVYDDTVAHRPVAGLHWHSMDGVFGGRKGVSLACYTAERMCVFEGPSLSALTAVSDEPHIFGGVPLIEYWNDAQERGDVEPVLSLLDAYDTLQSDRLNDKQEFADSLLVLTGVSEVVSGDDPNDDRPVSRRLREDKALALPDREARVEWLTKQLNEADTQVLASALRSDIHKLAMVPDLSDERFSGNASGVALKYKLLGLEQLVMIKERYFREGLRGRLRLAARAMEFGSGVSLDPEAVEITFSRTLPTGEITEGLEG